MASDMTDVEVECLRILVGRGTEHLKKMRYILIALFSSFLLSCSDVSDDDLTRIFTNHSSLYDPGSVTFRNVSSSKDGDTVCGELNAKNRLGGYVGWKRFGILDAKTTNPSIYIEGAEAKEMEAVIFSSTQLLCDM